jgi:hypothetical protein
MQLTMEYRKLAMIDNAPGMHVYAINFKVSANGATFCVLTPQHDS